MQRNFAIYLILKITAFFIFYQFLSLIHIYFDKLPIPDMILKIMLVW